MSWRSGPLKAMLWASILVGIYAKRLQHEVKRLEAVLRLNGINPGGEA